MSRIMPPVKKLILQLHIDRGEENIRCCEYSIEFNEPPTPQSAADILNEVFGAAVERALEELDQ